MILDGFGIAKDYGNAIKKANTPNLDKIFSTYPLTCLSAMGEDVGLPEGQMGNSEVGHTNIGAGRIVYQELTRINKAIKDGEFFENQALLTAIDNAKKNNKSLHLMGLLSNGGVHSHIDHLFALLKLCKDKGLEKVYVHAILDGRDTSPTSGKKFIADLQNEMNKLKVGKIATIVGRYYTMDRDNRWDRVKKAYDAMTSGKGKFYSDPVLAVENSYKENVTDEFLEPVVCTKDGLIKPSDSVIFFNFRPDRAREITRCFVDRNLKEFEIENIQKENTFVCMTEYDKLMPNVMVAFPPEKLKKTFGEYIASKGLTQLRIAETEKYAHVTFFFNGGVEHKYEGEDRILIASPKVATYDLMPQMSAFEVTENVIREIQAQKYDVIILNFANCDMVGHTGNFDATVKAVEAVDKCVGEIIDQILKVNGVALITADHGNAEKMLDESKKPFTAHTTNPVPFCVINYPCKLKDGGKLSNIAPTMLQILGFEKPLEMSADGLIK